MAKLLIGFEDELLARVERERDITFEQRKVRRPKTAKRPPRTVVIRDLLVEALNTRAEFRGETMYKVETLVPVKPEVAEAPAPETAPAA